MSSAIFNRANIPYAVWAMALVATLSSLALSEGFHLVPCLLCWYQRIFMYPLVVIVGVAILRRDNAWPYTVLPLSIIGMAIALYHSLLQWKILPDAIAPCQAGISCTTAQIHWLGFITIPFMSLVAFSIITLGAYLQLRGDRS